MIESCNWQQSCHLREVVPEGAHAQAVGEARARQPEQPGLQERHQPAEAGRPGEQARVHPRLAQDLLVVGQREHLTTHVYMNKRSHSTPIRIYSYGEGGLQTQYKSTNVKHLYGEYKYMPRVQIEPATEGAITT